MLSYGPAGQVLTSNGTTPPSWSPVSIGSTIIGVANGGTGTNNLTGILVGNGTNNVTTLTAPSSAVVGVSDTQTLSNKTLGAQTALGTPSSGNLSNCTSLSLTSGVSDILPVANGGTGSASAATGTGGVVLANSPTISDATLTGAQLGTPDSGNLSNCTSLPLTTGTSGVLPVSKGGTGIDTLTGYVFGSGTGSLSASETIPFSAITGAPSGLTVPPAGFVTSNGTVLGSVNAFSLELDVSGTLPVDSGGTGMVAPNGYLKGDGLGGITAESTIPFANLSGIDTTTGYLKSLGNGTVDSLSKIPVADIDGLSPAITVPASGVVTSNGTILNSVSVLPVTSGGTGFSSISNGAMLYGMSGQLEEVVPSSAGVPLIASGPGLSPSFTSLNLSTANAISGTLAASHGGTGYQQRSCGQFYSTGSISSIALNTQNQNVLVPLSSNVASSLLDNFSLNTSTGSLVYGNFATRRFYVSFTCSFTLTAAANVAFHIAVGSSPDAASRSVVTGSGPSIIQTLSTQCLMELPANSQIRVYAAQTTTLATVALVVQSMNLSVIPA
jgi:hypothetical protein